MRCCCSLIRITTLILCNFLPSCVFIPAFLLFMCKHMHKYDWLLWKFYMQTHFELCNLMTTSQWGGKSLRKMTKGFFAMRFNLWGDFNNGSLSNIPGQEKLNLYDLIGDKEGSHCIFRSTDKNESTHISLE